MTDARYFPSQDITKAVKGRETEILDSLRIDWRAGQPHITCPYPDHGGIADWRWDARAAKAFCTCAPGDSIFDVVISREGCDFEAAKLWVAEALRRRDLIRQKSGKTGSQRQTDAASLPNPPPDARDDALVCAYLGHRLGIPADEVPLPSTSVVGWRSLPYFDPPETGRIGAKPTLVGRFPFAVFGTVAAGRHTHRIYLAEGGAGKADLGTDRNGRPRDPKKSVAPPLPRSA